MRRSTCTINYGKKVPLAQGVNFDLWSWVNNSFILIEFVINTRLTDETEIIT